MPGESSKNFLVEVSVSFKPSTKSDRKAANEKWRWNYLFRIKWRAGCRKKILEWIAAIIHDGESWRYQKHCLTPCKHNTCKAHRCRKAGGEHHSRFDSNLCWS